MKTYIIVTSEGQIEIKADMMVSMKDSILLSTGNECVRTLVASIPKTMLVFEKA